MDYAGSMSRVLIHATTVIQPQGNGSFAGTMRELPIMVVGKDPTAVRQRVEQLAADYVRWMETTPQPEWDAWLDDLQRRGATVEMLIDGQPDVRSLTLVAHG